MMYSQAEYDAEVERARSQAYKAGFDEGYAKVVKAERARLAKILTGAEAEGREDAAQALAFDGGGISADAAVAILRTLPRAERRTLPGDRARNAAGGLVIDGGQELDPRAAFEHGQAIADSLPRGVLK